MELERGVGERQRQRETKAERERQRGTETKRQRHRKIDKDRHGDRQIDIQTVKEPGTRSVC